MHVIVRYILIHVLLDSARAWKGHTYYNSRYGGDGISYSADDGDHGLFSDTDEYLITNPYTTDVYSGCSYNKQQGIITTCTGNAVVLANLPIPNITAGTFSENTRSIQIWNCGGFTLFEDRTFENLTQLNYMLVQGTGLNHVPDLSNTVISNLNLAGNRISIDTNNHNGWEFPSTIQRIALMNNLIYWIPEKMISGPNLRIVSFGNNRLTQIQQHIFGDTSALVYLGMDGNQIERISRNSIAPLATNNFLHLNMSNNRLFYIQGGTFNQLPALKILELHQNSLSDINVNILQDLPNLVHLDLHANNLQTLPGKAIENIPQLKELRLHSQKTPMTSIAYNAWSGIDNIIELFVSSNQLSTFPHQVLGESTYPLLEKIHADNNRISNITKYGEEAFPDNQFTLHAQREREFVPFAAVPAVRHLWLHDNWITTINTTDLCEMNALRDLFLQNNYIRESKMDVDCFACLPVLYQLDLRSNLIQYVPDCLKSTDVLPFIKILKLNSNKIKFLETGDFTNLTTVTNLYLSYNGILAIENNVFPPNVVNLRLNNNEFRFLHQYPFQNLTSLNILTLYSNEIQHIPDNAFMGCTTLSYLYLNGNNIPQLKKNFFEDAPLNGNLSVANNDIGWIEDGTFAHISSMNLLDLSNNKLTLLPIGGDFHDLTVHLQLDLSNNRINILKTDNFKNLVLGESFYLSGNQITEIESYAFNGLWAMNLYLTENPLRKLNAHSLYNLHISESIFMHTLSFSTIPSYAFDRVGSTHVYISSGGISYIEEAAFNEFQVATLDLGHNALSILGNSIFGGVSHVSDKFYIDGNNMSGISYEAFDNCGMKDIYLGDNVFTLFPQVLQTKAFRYIDLSNNLITEIPTGYLAGQTALEVLYMSNNLLTYFEDGVFEDLGTLFILSLAGNNLNTLSEGILVNLTQLEELYLSGNAMTHVPSLGEKLRLRKVDFSSNSIATLANSAFTELTSLTELNLGNNPLECSCQMLTTLEAVATSVISGTCAQNDLAYGVTFAESSSTSPNYFLLENATFFQCSGENVVSSNIGETSFTLIWDQPEFTYFRSNDSLLFPYLTGPVNYTVNCTSASGTTITDLVIDDEAVNGSSSFNVTFVEADGVLPGTLYECSVITTMEGQDSAKSPPAVFTTPDGTGTILPAGPNDIVVDATFYDFSKLHADFDDLQYITISNPSYVDSPYGAWLSASSTPTSDTFSTWYRKDDVNNNNYEIDGTLILRAQTGTIKRYYSDSYFPVDGQGYGAQSQQDCNGQYHNFGFTTAIRTGIVYSGSEKITLSGGEAMWFYINKVRLFEFVSVGSGTIPCYVIDLSSALAPDGVAYIQEGSLSGESCTSLSTATNISLPLENGVTYHLDIFHAETRRCNSELLFEVEDTVFSLDKTVDLPIDYSVTWNEDTQLGEILANVNLIDDFSAGSYSISLYKGNEGRRFTIQSPSYTFTAAPVPAPDYTTITDIEGNTVNYVECNSTSPLVAMANDTSAESFSIPATSLYVILSDELDYEVVKEYYLLMTVTDLGKPLTGYIAVRLVIDDVNDNCPILSPTSVTMAPQPVLREPALATFTVSDADSGENANIHYVVSSVTEDPPSTYTGSEDLWDVVYVEYTSLLFNVIAMDNGTVPFGMIASMNITVSNTCVLDVLFGKIAYMFHVNDTTGEMTLRVPGYWMYEFNCDEVIGLTTGTVLDNMLSASSAFNQDSTHVGRARVDQIENVYSELAGAWVAGILDTNQYVEVDMGLPYQFTGVYIQGRADADEWVTSFKILYYDSDIAMWTTYTDALGQDTFTGNTDRTTVVRYDLDPVILSNKVRVNPQTWSGNMAMRIEFDGCQQAEQTFYDVSCQRCETTYYCEGEGIQKMCGRCADTNTTCDRNPTEHSFGAQIECSPCPVGWICKDGYATPCDEYHYETCTNTSCPATCTQCEPGYSCYLGIRSMCLPGSYSDGFQEHCVSCDEGYYQDLPGQSSCKSCNPGFYSARRMDGCEKCEPEEYSLGVICIACSGPSECPCLLGNKCYSDSYCYNTGSGGFGCTACEAGLTGDGTTCTDIDECTVHKPCFQDRCINTEPGYQCLECPEGYSGTYEDAYSHDKYLRVFKYINLERSNFTYQECEDIDECATDNGGCDPRMECVNTIGSYYCGFCSVGYIGTNRSGCYLDNFCLSGAHDCTELADCVYLGPALYRCVCKPGYAGNGVKCGPDADMDGFPDSGQPCLEWGCKRDNCGVVPNSMQEDTDGYGFGDNCDENDDRDNRNDYEDNCQFVDNNDLLDTDGDGIGDACDNCPNDGSSSSQADADSDGIGDLCDTDDDNDGIVDVSDNCPLVANTGQEDGDGDGVGDACDNCPATSNPAQTDSNANFYGDACDAVGASNIDEDGDGIPDAFDNCPSYMNGDQADTDNDGIGDLCDSDIDADGVDNENDNCAFYSNSVQTDVDGNRVGDICELDHDNDGVDSTNDSCPYNAALHESSFKDYFTVDLYPSLTTVSPVWLVKNNGGEVMQTTCTEMPTMLIGKQLYGAIQYRGTWFTDHAGADEFFGFVFGYANNRKFYVVMWKGKHYNYKKEDASTYKGGIQGAQIKLVDSSTGPSSNLAEALWHSYTVSSQTRMIWQDPDMNGWEPLTAYRWYLTHRPSIGYISLQIYQGTNLICDSGDLYDSTITGGRVGVLQFGEFPVIWSNLQVDCLEHTNQGLYFDGTDDYVELDDAVTLGMENSFTIETWLSLDTGYTTGPYPLFCSAERTVCLSIESSKVIGRYGDFTVTSSTSLVADKWYNIVFRHRIESETISIFIDGTKRGETNSVTILDLPELYGNSTDLTMFIGKDGSSYFRGTMDEVRLYSEGIQDDELTSHIGLQSVERPALKYYGNLHFRMEDSMYANTTLYNSGRLAGATATLNGGSLVQSYQQYEQFTISNPNNK